eukprot:jgi/Tetstr1/462372/TSEL_007378.t1
MRHRLRRQWQDSGASDQVLRWIEEGVRIPFKHNRPTPNFHNGISVQDATPALLTFLEGELARFVESGAWEFGTCREWVSSRFLLPTPGINHWRGIIDLRVLNSYFRQAPGVDIDSTSGMFYAPADKLDRLSSRQATRLIGRATRKAMWLQSNGKPIHRPLETAYLHIDSSCYEVLNGRLDARGLCNSADERQHITCKELKAVRLAVESFLPHLTRRNDLMHEDNQARAAGSALTIDRFASALNTMVPRYSAAWLDPTCEAVDSLHLPDADWR